MESIDLTQPAIYRDLQSFACSLLSNNEDAQDVVQEVIQQCLEQKTKNFNRSYLFQAVRYRSLNKIRSKHRRMRAMERLGEFLRTTLVESEEIESSVSDLVMKLPSKQRQVLILRIKAELKVSEIAKILEIPEGTVKSRINKAMKTLKNSIKEKNNGSF